MSLVGSVFEAFNLFLVQSGKSLKSFTRLHLPISNKQAMIRAGSKAIMNKKTVQGSKHDGKETEKLETQKLRNQGRAIQHSFTSEGKERNGVFQTVYNHPLKGILEFKQSWPPY